MYHAFLVVGLCVAYAVFAYGFAWFFEAGPVRLSWRSVALIALVAVAGDAISTRMGDWQLDNRVLHVLGGGVPAYLACVLAARAAQVRSGRARIALLASLLATALGVANEHMELFLQMRFHLRFAAGPLDTWLDLASNTVGIILAALLLWWALPRAREHSPLGTPEGSPSSVS